MRSIANQFALWWERLHGENSQEIEQLSAARTRSLIVLASATALYLELVMIRWHATSAHAFAIFKNVSLLSCFLGLGIGFALSGQPRKLSMDAVLPLLAVQTLLFSVIPTTVGGMRVNPVAEQMVMGLHTEKWSWLHLIGGNAFLSCIFVLNATMFIPLGYVNGRLMNRLPNIQGYSLNLLGSLLGVSVFFLISFIWAPPAVWIGLGLVALLPFVMGNRRMMALGTASAVVVLIALGLVGRYDERRYYSPYQLITFRLPGAHEDPPSPSVKVNSAFYQQIYDCSVKSVAAHSNLAEIATYYNLPYRIRQSPGHVCVVGAGTGNDVAAALRNGATHVTAVEIDPAIIYLGKRLHPERPYHDPRAKVVNDDARTHLRQTQEKYDTIIYGLLDSHTNMGAMTNVRLDSFVYTLEGFQEAMACLKERGLLVVSYLLMDQSQGDKLYALLAKAWPHAKPKVLRTESGVTFVTGPELTALADMPPGVTDQTSQFAAAEANTDLPTDDWPYFYMQKRTYPLTYAGMIAVLLVLSAWMVKQRLGGFGKPTAKTGVFFFLGAGFMLIETKVITELGLVFGNTWAVSAIAIVGVLIMCFLANQWIGRIGPLPQIIIFGGLALSLLTGFAVNQLAIGNSLPLPKLLLPIALVSPLFFAGLIFSGMLTRGCSMGEAMSANLFGAMLGGFLEYNSMYWGLSSLYPLGIGIYALAFACAWLDQRSSRAALQASETQAVGVGIRKAA